jgi:hypothetical protein
MRNPNREAPKCYLGRGVYEKSRREFYDASVAGKRSLTTWSATEVRCSSFPLDGGRSRWGCQIIHCVKQFTSYFCLPCRRLCRNKKKSLGVMLSGAKHPVFSVVCEAEIFRLSPQDDITTQSLEGEEIRRRTSFIRVAAHGRSSSVIFFFVIALLFISSSAGAQAKKIKLCAPGLGSGIMHAYVAKERGYFAQEGLDLDVLVTRGQICTMAMLNGQMELSSNPNVFDAMVAGRFKGKVIYVSARTLGHRFIVAPEIKSFDGLKQKNIAVSTFGGLTDMLTREILEQHGINPAKDVVLLQIGTPDVRYASLKAGTVRAALLASTQGLQAVKEGFRELP